ncbi:MAG TPA: hypothetical protein VGR48_02725 [Terriglobales bacterium]|nr:hypothetical protein [Terriglobales bacterium]
MHPQLSGAIFAANEQAIVSEGDGVYGRTGLGGASGIGSIRGKNRASPMKI